jgi:hypothetical protein
VSQPCTVVIGAAEVLSALKERAATEGTELLAFSDADALRALEVITDRRPSVVALERLFAATPRGAALINRIKADPSLTASEIRVVSHDSDYMRVSRRRTADAAVVRAPQTAPTPSLDQRGTRRAPRVRIVPPIDVMVDGNRATLVDLSTVGAQVVSTTVLKPNQRVRLALTDEHVSLRFNGAVAWASFEIPPNSGPRYRAGIMFLDADSPSVGSFASRHKSADG